MDANCLIGLSKVQMETLPLQLYSKVIIPPAVLAEFGGVVEGYIVQSPSNRVIVQTLRLMLGAGESEVIALGVELSQGGEQVEMVLDDLQARRIALSYGLRIVGTVGLLIRAKQSGYAVGCPAHPTTFARLCAARQCCWKPRPIRLVPSVALARHVP